MPTGVALMMTSKEVLASGFLLDGLGAGLAGELLRGFGGAVEDEDFGAAVAHAEDGGPSGPAGPEDEDLGAAQRHALLERADDAGDVGVEAEEFSVEQTDGVDRADLGGERVGLLEVREDLLLERHGDGDALDGDFVDQFEQVGEFAGLQREVDGVDGLAAEGGVHHDGRE